MKKVFSMLWSWFSSRQVTATRVETVQTLPMPDHERRLGKLQQSGRMLFLP